LKVVVAAGSSRRVMERRQSGLACCEAHLSRSGQWGQDFFAAR
jgi:hypothetical protein